MKTLPFISLCLSLCCTVLSAPNLSVSDFEKRFLSHYPTNNSESVRLIGYKKVFVPADEVVEFEGHWNSEKETWPGQYSDSYNYFSHVYYDPSEKAIRLYFPVEGALLEHDSDIVEADEFGQLPQHVHTVNGPCKVLGRKKTHHVHGVEGNIIKDGIIYLAEPNGPIRQYGNAYVYDFGTKSLHEHNHDHDHSYGLYVIEEADYEDGQSFELARDTVYRRSSKGANARASEPKESGRRKRKSKNRRDTPEEDENGDQSGTQPNKGCVANHGGINCSKKYGYNEGRCPFNPNTCMDYNGFFTDCVKGTNEGDGMPSMSKTVKFIGSDCSISVADGHCWNEL